MSAFNDVKIVLTPGKLSPGGSERRKVPHGAWTPGHTAAWDITGDPVCERII
jgi:hypothetical protein